MPNMRRNSQLRAVHREVAAPVQVKRTPTPAGPTDGIAISGELPYVSPVDEVLSRREIDACLVVIDGWPMSRC